MAISELCLPYKNLGDQWAVLQEMFTQMIEFPQWFPSFMTSRTMVKLKPELSKYSYKGLMERIHLFQNTRRLISSKYDLESPSAKEQKT